MSKAESLEWEKRPKKLLKKGEHPEYAVKKHDAEASHGSYRIDKYYDDKKHVLIYQPKGSSGGGRMVGGNAQYPSLGAAQKAAAEHHESKTKPEGKGTRLKAFADQNSPTARLKAHADAVKATDSKRMARQDRNLGTVKKAGAVQTSAKGARYYVTVSGNKVYVK